MASLAFVAGDFRIFDVQGFNPRMTEIRARVRPKLDAFGGSLASSVSRSVGDDVFAQTGKGGPAARRRSGKKHASSQPPGFRTAPIVRTYSARRRGSMAQKHVYSQTPSNACA